MRNHAKCPFNPCTGHTGALGLIWPTNTPVSIKPLPQIADAIPVTAAAVLKSGADRRALTQHTPGVVRSSGRLPVTAPVDPYAGGDRPTRTRPLVNAM